MKIFLIACIASIVFTSCKNGKLPNASITGATPMDYVPIFMMVIGGAALAYSGITYATGKTLDATKKFWFLYGGAVVFIFGLVWFLS